MNAILVCVDYGDLAALTIPYNRHNFDRMMVVTAPHDRITREIAERNRCELHVTSAFYDRGALFNKWVALEEGLDRLGREGWICILDADIVWPVQAPISRYLQPGFLYCPRRRMMEDTSSLLSKGIPDSPYWSQYPLHPQEREFAGYSQIFHAYDPRLGTPPWHQTNWVHAGGADSFFQARWPEHQKVRPPFTVLHLGPAGVNWCGRASAYLNGSKEVQGDERVRRLQELRAGRQSYRTRGVDPYAGEKLD